MILSVLGIEDFGVYNVVAGIVALLGFLSGPMTATTWRFASFSIGKSDQDELNNVFFISIILHVIIALIILFLLETIGLWYASNYIVVPPWREKAAAWIYQICIISSCIFILTVPFRAIITAHENMGTFAAISLFEAFAKLAVVFVLKICSYDKLVAYAILLLIVQVLVMTIYVLYSRAHYEEAVCRVKSLDRGLFNEMTRYAGWTVFGSAASVASNQGISLVLNSFFGPVANAARGVSIQVQNAIRQFVTSFQSAVNPQILKGYASKEFAEMNTLVIRSAKFSYYLVLIFILPIIIEIRPLLDLWLVDVPEYTVPFLRLILISELAFAINDPLSSVVSASGKVRLFQIFNSSLSLSVIPISIIIFNNSSPAQDVFIVSLIISFMSLIVSLLFVKRISPKIVKDYILKVFPSILLVTTFSLALTLLIKSLFKESLLSMMLVCIICVMICILNILLMGVTQEERKFLFTNLLKFRK